MQQVSILQCHSRKAGKKPTDFVKKDLLWFNLYRISNAVIMAISKTSKKALGTRLAISNYADRDI